MTIINGTTRNDTYLIEDENTHVNESVNSGTDTVQSRGSYTLDNNVENLELLGSETQLINGMTVYGNPVEWGNYLDYYQGDNVQRNLNSCFYVAFENVLIQAGLIEPRTNYNPPLSGKDPIESAMLKIKSLAANNNINTSSLISVFSQITSELNTLYESQTFPGSTFLTPQSVSLTTIADYVKNGYCAVALCDAAVLWGFSTYFYKANHAVTVTGVAYNSNGTIAGFYICDSGKQLRSEAARFVSYDLMSHMMTFDGSINALTTDCSIKQYIDNINGTGNDLDNVLTGNSGQNILSGMDGNDTLNGAGGADTLYGGTGSDYYYINAKDTVVENADEGNDTVRVLTDKSHYLANNVENLYLDATTGVQLYGNSLGNSITGNVGNDTIFGNDGDDFLDGSTGSDKMYGGQGNDFYHVDKYDKVVEYNDQGIDTIVTYINYTLGNNLENIFMTGSNNIKGTGNSLDNGISGNNANNYITGNNGNDTLSGSGGNDSLYGGNGNDTYDFYSGDGQDIISDNQGTNYIEFGENITEDMLSFSKDKNNLVISISNSNDKITIQNYLYSSSYQMDKFTFSDDSEMIKSEISLSLNGDNLNNKITGSIIREELNGYAGNDCIYAGNGNDTLYGGTGNDYIDGQNDDDILYGNEDNDKLYGNNGNDTLIGGTGNDSLYGGNGNDTYKFYSGDGQDIISDNQGTNYIEFGENITRNMLSFSKDKNNLVISVDSNDKITIQNYLSNSNYQINEFIFSDNSRMPKADIILPLNGDSLNNKITGTIITDIINGNEGNDKLYGDYGADTITGGAGNDSLYGGYGNDTYIFGLGNGIDIISDNPERSNTDKISFDASVSKENIALFMQGNNLIIDYGNTVNQDKITVQNQKSSNYAIEKIELNDGKFLTSTEINNIVQNIAGYDTGHAEVSFKSVNDVKNDQYCMNLISNSWHS